jgi:ATP adenylyltransferase
MDTLWAPWRIRYVQMARQEGCILCQKPAEAGDTENYLLFRGKHNFVMLNAFPYNPGHLMISPYRHVASPELLSAAELHEHHEIVTRCLGILRAVFNPGGFNIGMNLGRVAGAGIDEPIHSHLVPRWQGDTNFMPVVGATRVIPEALAETYEKLRGQFPAE